MDDGCCGQEDTSRNGKHDRDGKEPLMDAIDDDLFLTVSHLKYLSNKTIAITIMIKDSMKTKSA